MRTRNLSRTLAVALAVLGCKGGGGSADDDPAYQLTPEVSGLGAVTNLAFLPDGRMVVTEKDGTVRLRGPAPGLAMTVAGQLAVDTESEKGLLGVIVPPDFAAEKRIVLYRSVASGAGGTDLDRNRVASFRLGDEGELDLGSEVVLASGLRGPANHDGGGMALGPDGKLYVGVGDSGCNGGRPRAAGGADELLRHLPQQRERQNPADRPGRVDPCGQPAGRRLGGDRLRRHVRPGPHGARPSARRHLGLGVSQPVALRLRSRDRAPLGGGRRRGDVRGADHRAGGEAPRLALAEGRHGWPVDKCRTSTPDTGDCVEPVYECRHGSAAADIDGGCGAITGGAFLTGPRWPEALRDRYVFGDSVTQDIWSVQLTPDRRSVVPGSRRRMTHTAGAPVSFRVGPDGDLFVAILPGQILRLSPAGSLR